MTMIPKIEEISPFEKLEKYVYNSLKTFEQKQKEDFKRLHEQLNEISRDIEYIKRTVK